MESCTIELAVGEGDPYDRTLSFMIKSDRVLIACRAIRIAPHHRIGELLLGIDRVVLAWALPTLQEAEHIHDTLDSLQSSLGYLEAPGPF